MHRLLEYAHNSNVLSFFVWGDELNFIDGSAYYTDKNSIIIGTHI